jgi:hypothetical protein
MSLGMSEADTGATARSMNKVMNAQIIDRFPGMAKSFPVALNGALLRGIVVSR